MSDGFSATDIITFVGVPLAVLGVLPILYNTFATLVALSRIKQMLRHSRLTALTRSDVVNRVIEIELPRYAVRPWDRLRHRLEYWSLSPHRSAIPGGSWTTFHWRTNVIGVKTQRVEYADQLRQPQAEVAFDELVSYLLDLGAVPDPHGWRLLRNTGLWTPVGCVLMTGPSSSSGSGGAGEDVDGGDVGPRALREKAALSIAPLEDSDGHLSLSVSWQDHWTTRDYSHLPPYWVQLPPWPEDEEGEEEGKESRTISNEDTGPVQDKDQAAEPVDDARPATGNDSTRSKKGQPSIDSARKKGDANRRRPITCHITADGLVSALVQSGSDSFHNSSTTLGLDSLYIDHLRSTASSSSSSSSSSRYGGSRGSNNDAGTWFASAATAFGTTSQTVLWSYRIPDDVVRFARRETVPCGVLVLLEMCPEAATPEWSATGSEAELSRRRAAELDAFARRTREQREALQAEARMPPAQREVAARDRMRREGEARLQEVRDRMRAEESRREARLVEALQSPKWDAVRVAERSLGWLRRQGETGRSSADGGCRLGGLVAAASGGDGAGDDDEPTARDGNLKVVVGKLLHRMVLDGELAGKVCATLELWRAWADNGGMRRSDLDALQNDTLAFALASLVVAVIKESSAASEGTLSMDLQECLRMWKTVRLG